MCPYDTRWPRRVTRFSTYPPYHTDPICRLISAFAFDLTPSRLPRLASTLASRSIISSHKSYVAGQLRERLRDSDSAVVLLSTRSMYVHDFFCGKSKNRFCNKLKNSHITKCDPLNKIFRVTVGHDGNSYLTIFNVPSRPHIRRPPIQLRFEMHRSVPV